MFTIQSYTDTKCELEMAKTRLNLLVDKKLRLYSKYFPLSAPIKDVVVDGGDISKDKMADYVHELHEVDIGTGMSLAEEIDYQQRNINTFQAYLDTMNDILSKMSGIEYQLFYEIVYNGVNVTKAVENIAMETGKDVSTIWKNYYSKIKNDIQKIALFGYNNQTLCGTKARK